MYQVHPYLGYLGDILPLNQDLRIGRQYTFTFVFPWYSQYPSSTDAIVIFSEYFSGIAKITGASRGIFSSNFVVSITPIVTLTLEEWTQAFDEAWKRFPWYVATPVFVQAEGGGVSTEPGGLTQITQQVTPAVGGAVGKTALAVLEPFLPYVFIFGGAYLLLKVGIPEYTKARKQVK